MGDQSLQTTAMRAYLQAVSSTASSVAPETVTIPAGAAGTVKDFYLKVHPIADANGSDIGVQGNTSLALTSTAFTNEVPFGTADTKLANGDFWVNYLTGHAHGRRADNSGTLTANYKTFSSNVNATVNVSVTTSPTTPKAATSSASGTVAATSGAGGTQIVASNANRAYVQCQNNGAVDVYFGAGTVTSSFLKVVPNGLFRFDSQEALKVLSSGANANIAFCEYTV